MAKNEMELYNNLTNIIDDKSLSLFDTFIGLVKELEDGQNNDIMVKWKSDCNQVVIETPSWFYKIYEHNPITEAFNIKIREKLGEIYRDNFHLDWEVKTVYTDTTAYQIERREKLQICNESIISFDDLLLNWANTLDILEKKLYIPSIVKQLTGRVPSLKNIKLIRNCANKYDDYGITKDGNIVLFDDADWFLAILDKNNKWINNRFFQYEVITPYGEWCFSPLGFEYQYFDKNIEFVGEIHDMWTLIPKLTLNGRSIKKKLVEKKNKMLQDNIQMFTTHKPLDNEKVLYIDHSGDNEFCDYKQIQNDTIKLIDNEKEV